MGINWARSVSRFDGVGLGPGFGASGEGWSGVGMTVFVESAGEHE